MKLISFFIGESANRMNSVSSYLGVESRCKQSAAWYRQNAHRIHI